jgi:heme A synthase
MKSKLNMGDKVAFSQAVIRRTNDGTRARGTVVSVTANVVAVDFAGTWISHEDGGTVRYVPIANLTKIQPNGVIFSD